ncbi:MAG: hypothetical protein MI717_13345 [Spirochaetales bacterium]|nr:hypothetical protein [Spirochaetales bacterium]
MSDLPHRFPVDNAAQIFVNIVSEGETTLSRIAFEMTETVDKDRLQQALENVLPHRFPYFQVYLRPATFSYVLERTTDLPQVEEDSHYTNRMVDFHSDRFLFRVRTNGKNIALELSHILSDGYGTLVLLYTLCAEYLRLGGVKVDDHPLIYDVNGGVNPQEWECPYTREFSSKGPHVSTPGSAYLPTGEGIPLSRYYNTRYSLNLEAVREKARGHRATVSVFLSGLYFWALQELRCEDVRNGVVKGLRPLRLQVPVNLRKDYPVISMKNFSYVYTVEWKPQSAEDTLSLEDSIAKVAEGIRHERHTHSVENQIRRNLRASQNFFFRFLPRSIKEFFLGVFYKIFARELFSGVLTSLGEIRFPSGMDEAIERVDILACNSPVPGRNSTCFGFRGKLEMSIGSTIKDLRLEQKIEEGLHQLGLSFDADYKRE